ncbi:hypothetical protein WA588_004780, partial [Blastocystis sp. NMH]
MGGVLIHLTLGTLYTASNLTTYVISYLHVVKQEKAIDSTLSPWIFALQSLGQAASMILGGVLQHALGIKWAMFIGCFLVSLSTLGGYYAVNNYFVLCATYGVLFGLGVGIAYSSPMTAAMKWLPNHRGLANGFIVLGFGLGSLIFNYVETFVINPNNAKPIPDPTSATSEKFFPFDVAERTPRVFLVLGICYMTLQCIGWLLISEPNEEEKKMLEEESKPLQTEQETLMESPRPQGMTPKEAAKTSRFWEIWLVLMFVSIANNFVSSFYKFFGQSFIENDLFLVTVGSVSAICNGFCRLLWGMINDRWGYKKAMGSMLMGFCVFIGTFSLSKFGGKWMFLVWVCGLYGCIGGAFAMVPTYVDRTFGSEYFGTIYGLTFTSIIISSLVGAFFVSAMVRRIGVLGISISMALLIFASFLLTVIPKDWSYRDRRDTNP